MFPSTLLIFSLFTFLVAPISAQQIQDTSTHSPLRERKMMTITGAIRSPMRVELHRGQIQLLDLLAYAGGITERAKGIVQIIHSSENRMGEIDTYNLDDLRQMKSNPLVRHGDHVFVLEADIIYVTGHVVNPSAYLMKDPMRVSEAIKLAGGALPDASSVKIVPCGRLEESRSAVIKSVTLEVLEKEKSKDFILGANDIVIVWSRSAGIRHGLISCPQSKEEKAQLPLRVIYR